MPFEGILEFLGASSLLVLVLGPFWKADDAISETLRGDISRWLIQSNIPIPRYPWVAIVNGVFVGLFGEKHLSLRCISISYLVSIAASIIIFYIFVAWLDTLLAPKLAQFGWPRGSQLSILLYLLLLINPIADFINLFLSRKIITRLIEVSSGLRMVFLMILIVVLPFVCSVVVLWIGLVMMEVYFGEINPDLPGLNAALGGLISGSGAMLTYGVAFTLLLTTFVSTVWVWSAIVGAFLIRLLSSSRTIHAYLTYALPVDERPVRSIGVFLTLLAACVLLIRALALFALTVL